MKIYIETIGCKLNQFESQAMAEEFKKKGFTLSDTLEESEFVVVNTCSVTNKADVKSRLVMKRAKKLGKIVTATGCYATTDFEELKNAEYADIIVKNDSKLNIPNLLLERKELEQKIPELARADEFPMVHQFEQTRAFVKIQDGCDRFCSYCKIPHARGRSRSLSPDTILYFIKSLIASGYRELVLTGVNISDYRYEGLRLSGLLEKILVLPGDFRLRLSSLQPDEFELSILDLLVRPDLKNKLANHFHLSLQSGSTTVLERMERHYTGDFFLNLIQQIHKKSPDAGISTDIIAGFPGETDAEFQETVDLVHKSKLTRVHVFPYSPRSHTKAARLRDTDSTVKKERVRLLEEAAAKTALEFASDKVVGKEHLVLMEAAEKGYSAGYTTNYFKVYTKRKLEQNTFELVRADRAVNNGTAVELYED